jgi:RNA polymerase sigma factor (TIGR02999 family)
MSSASGDAAVVGQGDDDVQRLLDLLDGGDQEALDELFPYIYDELSEVAHRLRQRWRGDYTLNTTALIHEGYLKLVGQKQIRAESRAHFLALAGKAMRHILINYARGKRAQRRGGDARVVPIDEGRTPAGYIKLSARQTSELLTLHQVLRCLQQVNARQCRVVECRFFAGMTVDETASAVGVSARTVKRDWAIAQAYLNRAMSGSDE